MYTLPEFDLVIHEITGGNTHRLEAMIDLFVTYYPEYAYYAPRIRHVAQSPPDYDPGFVQHQWLADIDGQPAGMIVFKYVEKRDCGIGLDLVVHPDFRRLRLGEHGRLSELLVRRSIHQLNLDAQAAGREAPLGLLVEVENSRLVEHYQRNGFVPLPANYVEPPYIFHGALDKDPPKEDFHPMWLGLFPNIGMEIDPADPRLLTQLVSAFLIDHYGLPGDHWALCRALNSIGYCE